MGMALLIESDPELECPDAFPDTDSKHFLGTMFGPRVEVLERRLKLDLTPLKHCAIDVAGIEEDEFDPEWVEQAKRSCELAWHPPDAIIACLEALAAKLQGGGGKLPSAVHKAIDPTGRYRDYYQSGVFLSDVSGCLAALRSLKEQGAQRVRFFAF